MGSLTNGDAVDLIEGMWRKRMVQLGIGEDAFVYYHHGDGMTKELSDTVAKI